MSATPPPGPRAFVGLGSNLGDRWSYLRHALDQLRAGPFPVVAVSPVYETEPVGGPEDQGAYLNLVVELTWSPGTDPFLLLAECRRLEAAAERVRTVRWGPRTLDVDVVWVDGVTSADPELTIPHPRWRERRFVLAPLRDLAPDLVSRADLEAAGGAVVTVGTL